MSSSGHCVSVRLFSADNPDATYLTAGLLHSQQPQFAPVTIQNIDLPIISPEVLAALDEVGITFGRWRPRVVDRDDAQPVDVGITLCVPT